MTLDELPRSETARPCLLPSLLAGQGAAGLAGGPAGPGASPGLRPTGRGGTGGGQGRGTAGTPALPSRAGRDPSRRRGPEQRWQVPPGPGWGTPRGGRGPGPTTGAVRWPRPRLTHRPGTSSQSAEGRGGRGGGGPPKPGRRKGPAPSQHHLWEGWVLFQRGIPRSLERGDPAGGSCAVKPPARGAQSRC